jgi:mevalonate kinase
MSFEARIFGKWILAGEHSVLRGCPALVFPLKSRALEIQYLENQKPLVVEMEKGPGDGMESLLWKVLDRACEKKGIQKKELKGVLRLRNNIPIGAGLGASAALCVGLAKWFQALGHIDESELYEFSRSLEDLFHGESSGVDIAVAISGSGIKFFKDVNLERKAMATAWQPMWYLSYSGQRGITSECVQKVKNLIERDPETGSKIDGDMAKAVELAERALHEGEETGFLKLKEAMSLANSCFERWNLSGDEPVAAHLHWLMEQGAAAVKPTGSGGGGYVLSLWQKPPSKMALLDLIPL